MTSAESIDRVVLGLRCKPLPLVSQPKGPPGDSPVTQD